MLRNETSNFERKCGGRKFLYGLGSLRLGVWAIVRLEKKRLSRFGGGSGSFLGFLNYEAEEVSS